MPLGGEGGAASVQVLLAHESALALDGLTRLLEKSNVEVIATTSVLRDIPRKVRAYRPDLLAVGVPARSSDELVTVISASHLREELPGMALLFIDEMERSQYSAAKLIDGRSGFGYLIADSTLDADGFLDALRRLLAGDSIVDRRVLARMVAREDGDGPMAGLGAREKEALALAAAGWSNASIATRMSITRRTVESHLTAAYSHLEIPDDPGVSRRVLASVKYLQRVKTCVAGVLMLPTVWESLPS